MTEPQPGPSPYYPPPPPPHSHDKYVGAIIGAGVIALIVGAAIGLGLGSSNGYRLGYDSGYTTGRTSGYDTGFAAASNSQPRVTFTSGTVRVICGGSECFLDAIFFENQDTPDFGSPIAGDYYQLYLESGKTYQVTIAWTEYTSTSSEFRTCQAHPQPFTPTGTSYTQNFSC